MDRKQGWSYTLLMLGSLLLLAIDHRGELVGDRIFRAVGIPPWSEPGKDQGLHYSVIVGIVLFIVGARLTVRYFRQRHRRVGRKVLLLCFLFLFLFPRMTEFGNYALHWRGSGLDAVDFVQKEGRCQYGVVEDVVSIDCTLRLLNYGGKKQLVHVRPILRDHGGFQGIWSFAEVQYRTLSLPPRSNEVYNLHFQSKPDERLRGWGASGTTMSFGVEIVADGEKKEAYTEWARYR